MLPDRQQWLPGSKLAEEVGSLFFCNFNNLQAGTARSPQKSPHP